MDPAVVLLPIAAAAAGWVDAVVGGGGLLQIPALLLAYPTLPPATALGTNKLAAVFGTGSAAIRYTRATSLDLRSASTAAAAAVGSAALGAYVAAGVSQQTFRPVLLALLLAVLAMVVFRPTFGVEGGSDTPRWRPWLLLAIGAGIGFYDGVFGPGTGTFLILSFTAALSLDFVHSSAMAKIVNVGTNLGALAVFAAHGNVVWRLGLLMAIANVIGAQLGAHTALKHGAGFVRLVLVVVVVAMVLRLGYLYLT